VGVKVLKRPHDCCVGRGKSDRIVERGGLPGQRLHCGDPPAAEIGLDRRYIWAEKPIPAQWTETN
jgi:hypothetical protein